ncbi:Siderophore iron transporter mirA [Kluyveromyces marxianus]|uniref:Siderophore iron transporter mirA n=2 Tax=Kluyveromyces marxianus TaxID=4911 RepID=W0T6T1_KLUMD|nr:siderophore iron transporter mirA [Kluyveromyces marxianus DMKU3-1042]BAO39307.1 siderophore iron transporter mirA [Kluyveromyces marxianus DMKU3-1042]BAP70810.1 siderophore iron transporter mirA [Kluyveromyces marxianus]
MREDITKSTSSEEVGDVTASVEDSLQKKSSDNENVYEIVEPEPVYEKAWSKNMIIVAYAVLFFTAFVETFASDSTKNLDSYATSSFNAHSLLATIAVVYKITAICAYPVFAKVADILGRGEGFGVSIVFYTLAYLLYAACQNVNTYVCAEIFYALGRNGYRVFQQIFIADTTSLVNRGIWSQLPVAISAIPSLYAGSYIQDAFLKHSTWRWGYGTFCIILAASAFPLTFIMLYMDKRAKKAGERKQIAIFKDLPEGSWYKKALHVMFVELDLIGGALLLAGFAVFFVPLTLTGSKSSYKWHEPRLIAMIVVGFVIFCMFLVWNFSFKKRPFPTRKPFVPAQSFANKTVVVILILNALDLCENSSFATYFATTLQVGGYYTAGQASRIDNAKKVTVQIASILTGLAMKYTKLSKIYVLGGVPLVVLGHGLLVYFMNRNGVMESTIRLNVMEIFIGFGRGMYQSATQVLIQAIAGVEGIAMSTAFFLAFQSIGSLIGSAIAGGIWNSIILRKLDKYLPPKEKKNAKKIFKSIKVAMSYKKHTPTRDAISRAYRETLQIIGYTGLGIIAPMLILMFFVREVKLTDKHDAYGNDARSDTDSNIEGIRTDPEQRQDEKPTYSFNQEKRTWTNFWRV